MGRANPALQPWRTDPGYRSALRAGAPGADGKAGWVTIHHVKHGRYKVTCTQHPYENYTSTMAEARACMRQCREWCADCRQQEDLRLDLMAGKWGVIDAHRSRHLTRAQARELMAADKSTRLRVGDVLAKPGPKGHQYRVSRVLGEVVFLVDGQYNCPLSDAFSIDGLRNAGYLRTGTGKSKPTPIA